MRLGLDGVRGLNSARTRIDFDDEVRLDLDVQIWRGEAYWWFAQRRFSCITTDWEQLRSIGEAYLFLLVEIISWVDLCVRKNAEKSSDQRKETNWGEVWKLTAISTREWRISKFYTRGLIQAGIIDEYSSLMLRMNKCSGHACNQLDSSIEHFTLALTSYLSLWVSPTSQPAVSMAWVTSLFILKETMTPCYNSNKDRNVHIFQMI